MAEPMSTVIKAGKSGKALQRLSTVDLADHLAEANAVVARARNEAKSIATRAEADARREYEEAYAAGLKSGYDDGYEKGTREGLEKAYAEARAQFQGEHQQVVAMLREVMTHFDSMKEALRIAAKRDVLALAVRIASKLTFAIGELHHEAAAENLRRAVQLVGKRTDLTVRVNPQDVETLRDVAADLLKQVDQSLSVEFIEEPSIAPGGCRVTTEISDIDATLESQVDEIVTLLLGANRADA